MIDIIDSLKMKLLKKKQWKKDSWKNTSNFLYDMFILHEKRKKMTKEKARKAIVLK
jgi:hypothetical protein